jgi:hypothetical protein
MSSNKELEKNIIKYNTFTNLQFEGIKEEFLKELNDTIQLKDKDFLKVFEELVSWVKFCKENKISNKFILESILMKWSNDDDFEGVIGDLASNIICPINLLQYLFETLEEDLDIVRILDVHIRTRYGQCMIFSLVAERLLQANNKETLEDYEWEHLMETVEEVKQCFQYDPSFLSRQSYSMTRDNKDVIRYIESKQKALNHAIVARKPKWVSLKKDETEENYKNRDLGKVSEDDETLLHEIKDFLDKNTNFKQEIKEAGDIAETNPEEIAKVMLALKNNAYLDDSSGLEESEKLFPIERFYGPANTMLGKDCCSLNGPCRMFYCVCREFDDDDDYESAPVPSDSQEWFLGKCEECEKKIEKFRHCVRFPVDGGGWIGCFCSFECMRKNRIRPIYDDDELRIKEIYKILNFTGVSDI